MLVQPDAPPRPAPRARFAERLVDRRHRAVLCVLLAVLLLMGLRVAAGGELIAGGGNPTDAESVRAAEVLSDDFDIDPAGVVVVIGSTSGRVDDPAVAERARAVSDGLAQEPGVTAVTSYWDTGAPPLRSDDGTYGLVLATLEGDEAERAERAGEIADSLGGGDATTSIDVTGVDVVSNETVTRTERDLFRAEVIGFPIVVLLLVRYLRRVVLAFVPIAAGLLTVIGGIALAGLLARLTTISVFSTNITVGLGLGLSIDYALLLISRYREEEAILGDRRRAMAHSIRTAGRTVVFSATTVAIALVGLAIFPSPFLRSMAYAGIIATALAAAVSVLVVPAMLLGLGDRAFDRRSGGHAHQPGFWYRAAMAVMRRPAAIAAAVIAVLLLVVSPIRHVNPGVTDDRNLPSSSEARQGAEILRSQFAGRESSPLRVVATGETAIDADPAAVVEYATALSAVDGVARVDGPTGSYRNGREVDAAGAAAAEQGGPGGFHLTVVPAVEPISDEGAQLVTDVRGVPAPFDVLVGGVAAERVDGDDALFGRLPFAVAFIAVAMFVALFMIFGSLLVPLKALILNTLSLSATFGAAVWIFQEGHLSGVLGFTATGTIPSAIPVLIFCVAFGLSMDYEVFLLSRIKEAYDRSGDPVESVATGLDRTGRIVTFAALLVAVVFAGFVFSSVTAIKLLGLGLTLAVLLDAYVIRGLLLPAFMKLAGHANWWAPAPLRRLHDRFGLREHVALDDGGAVEPVAAPVP